MHKFSGETPGNTDTLLYMNKHACRDWGTSQNTDTITNLYAHIERNALGDFEILWDANTHIDVDTDVQGYWRMLGNTHTMDSQISTVICTQACSYMPKGIGAHRLTQTQSLTYIHAYPHIHRGIWGILGTLTYSHTCTHVQNNKGWFSVEWLVFQQHLYGVVSPRAWVSKNPLSGLVALNFCGAFVKPTL